MRNEEEAPHELALSAPVSRLPVALRNLLRRPMRSIMTAAAVSISMALLISMFSVSEGIKDSAEVPLLESREDLVVNPDQGKIEQSHAMADEISSWQEVEFATPALYQDMRVMLPVPDGGGDRYPKVVEALGIVPAEFWELMGEQERERFDLDNWFEVPDDPFFGNGTYDGPFTGEILLSEDLRGPDLKEGDTLPVIGIDGIVNMTVVGFFNHEWAGLTGIADLSFAICHLSELQALTGMAWEGQGPSARVVDLANLVSVALTPEAVEDHKEDEVAERIRTEFPEYADDVYTKEDQLELIRQETVLAEVFYIAIGSVSMLIGLLFVATIMIVSVLERTREIGMLRAIGISRRSVFSQIVTESMVLVLLGALIGILPGYYGAVWAADRISSNIGVTIELGFSASFVAWSLFLVVLVGLLFAMYPAYVAVRMNIVKAITSTH
jgi:putative ABC transport system permease protein